MFLLCVDQIKSPNEPFNNVLENHLQTLFNSL
jgi:hypothetical protein